jgi:FMN phosphatase YigB (HAD superfamily)
MGFKAVMIDMYGTLVEEDTHVIEGILADIDAGSPIPLSMPMIGRLWDDQFASACAEAYGEQFRTQRAIIRDSLGWVLQHFILPFRAEVLTQRQFDYLVAPTPFDDTAEFLAHCPVPICIVSNIDTADLDAAIAHLGWDIPLRVSSEDCRSYKPRHEMFERALYLLGCAPDEVLHIGDSWANDVGGAQSYGIPVAWLNRDGRKVPRDGKTPDLVIQSLYELPSILRGEF